MVGRADERSGFDVFKANLFASPLVSREFIRMHEADDGKMVPGRLQILAESEDICSLRGKILHGGEDFLCFLPKTQHETRLCGDVWMHFLGAGQEFKRALVDGTFANLTIEAWNRFGVVIEYVRLDRKDNVQGIPIAAKIGNQDFDLASWNAVTNLFNRACEDAGTPIRLIITIDARDHSVTQLHARGCFSDTVRFFLIGRADGLSGRHRTKTASACANVSEDHERSRAMLPAFSHVGAAGGFADRMEIERPHDALEIVIFFATEEFDAKPVRARVSVRRRHKARSVVREDVKGRSHYSAQAAILRGMTSCVQNYAGFLAQRTVSEPHPVGYTLRQVT